jgi:hypothetical protein
MLRSAHVGQVFNASFGGGEPLESHGPLQSIPQRTQPYTHTYIYMVYYSIFMKTQAKIDIYQYFENICLNYNSIYISWAWLIG